MLSFLLSPFVRLFHVILGLGTSQSFPPPLDAIEEDAAFRQSRTHPDPVRREEARQKLILHNLRLVSHIVRKYYASSRDQTGDRHTLCHLWGKVHSERDTHALPCQEKAGRRGIAQRHHRR